MDRAGGGRLRLAAWERIPEGYRYRVSVISLRGSRRVSNSETVSHEMIKDRHGYIVSSFEFLEVHVWHMVLQELERLNE